jgi:hypothetical protein
MHLRSNLNPDRVRCTSRVATGSGLRLLFLNPSDNPLYTSARAAIKHKMSTAFYLQTDGLAENANGVVECFLKAYIASDPQPWD